MQLSIGRYIFTIVCATLIGYSLGKNAQPAKSLEKTTSTESAKTLDTDAGKKTQAKTTTDTKLVKPDGTVLETHTVADVSIDEYVKAHMSELTKTVEVIKYTEAAKPQWALAGGRYISTDISGWSAGASMRLADSPAWADAIAVPVIQGGIVQLRFEF